VQGQGFSCGARGAAAAIEERARVDDWVVTRRWPAEVAVALELLHEGPRQAVGPEVAVAGGAARHPKVGADAE